MEASANRIEVGRVIGESFDLYKRNAGVLLGSAVLVFVISGVIQGLLQEAGGVILQLLAAIVSMVAVAIYTGFVVKLVEDVRRDGARDFSVGELMSSAGPAIAPLVGNSILRGIAVTIGFVLLIVPGLYLLTIWAVTSPAIVSERKGVIDAFGRSHELVRGQAWTVFGAIVVAFLITIGIGIVLAAIGAGIGGVAGAIVGGIIAGVLTAPIAALVSAILFFDLGGGAVVPEAPVAPAPAV